MARREELNESGARGEPVAELNITMESLVGM